MEEIFALNSIGDLADAWEKLRGSEFEERVSMLLKREIDLHLALQNDFIVEYNKSKGTVQEVKNNVTPLNRD